MIALPIVAAILALPPLMSIEDIKRGQEGTCMTVFEGDKLEPFHFKVKGVMRDFLGPKKDLVLIRLLGKKPEFTGVVAGMSGSPCSIDGKLVGALSYSFAAFAKEPIAGVTPMKDMLEVMRLPTQDRPWRMNAKADSAGAKADWDALQEGSFVADNARAQAALGGLRPIATPLGLGGVVPKVRDYFSPWLRSKGLLPMATGGSDAKAGRPGKALRPGDPVAAVLATGDVDIAGTGTVTSVEGNEVLAFGHPFLGAGAISVPMAKASILNTMATLERSFKMSATGELVGEITQDRLTAIGGVLGAVPKMVAVKGKLKTPAGLSSFSFEVARDFAMSPRFVAMGVASGLSGTVPSDTRGTVRIVGTVHAKGFGPIIMRNVFAAERDGNLMSYGAIELARTFSTFWSMPFGPPPDMSLTVEAEYTPDPSVEWVEAVYLDRPQVRPGESVDIAVRLGKENAPDSTEHFLLQVPHSWGGQQVAIVVAGVQGAEKVAYDVDGDTRPEGLASVRRYLMERRSDGYIYLMVVREGVSLRSQASTYRFLPPSAVVQQSGEFSRHRRRSGLAWEERRERKGVVMGGVSTPLRVLPY